MHKYSPYAYGVLTGAVLLIAGGVIFDDPATAIIGCVEGIIAALFILVF